MQTGERRDLKLAMKELMRQIQTMQQKFGEEAFDEAMSSGLAREAADLMEKLRGGKISQEDAQAGRDRVAASYEEMVQELGDPATLTRLRAENEAKTIGRSELAQMLVDDSFRAAASGKSEEDWIEEVEQGHAADEEALQGCREEIDILRKNGPWAWPRETEA